jgi:hypothetical protein
MESSVDSSASYLLDTEGSYNRQRALDNLAKVKEREATKKLIPVWIDPQTTKLMDMEKIKKRKLEIIRVKIGKGELAWMEKANAIKRGFINE